MSNRAKDYEVIDEGNVIVIEEEPSSFEKACANARSIIRSDASEQITPAKKISTFKRKARSKDFYGKDDVRKRFKKWFEESGYKQYELAEILHVSKDTVCRNINEEAWLSESAAECLRLHVGVDQYLAIVYGEENLAQAKEELEKDKLKEEIQKLLEMLNKEELEYACRILLGLVGKEETKVNEENNLEAPEKVDLINSLAY